MKRIYYLMAALLFSVASVSAQVTIGDNTDPHSGAVLELKTNTKGLLLPRINLEKVSVFQLNLEGTDTEADAAGMLIYNTNATVEDGDGVGLYIWDGTAWGKVTGGSNNGGGSGNGTGDITSAAPIPTIPAAGGSTTVTLITDCTTSGTWTITKVSGEGVLSNVDNSTGKFTVTYPENTTTNSLVTVISATDPCGYSKSFIVPQAGVTIVAVTGVSVAPTTATVAVGGTQQLTATVAPTTATNKAVSWASSNTSIATVSTNGLVTAVAVGTATITVTTTDGGKTATSTITVEAATNPDGSVDMEIGNNTYKTYTYTFPDNSSMTWMVENSKEGTASATYYNTNTNQSNGHYYQQTQAMYDACPSGWHLPSQNEWTQLANWVNSNPSHEGVKWWTKKESNAFAGFKNTSGMGQWWYWEEVGYWWTFGTTSRAGQSSGHMTTETQTLAGGWASVRCVKD